MGTCLVYAGIEYNHFAVPGGDPSSLTNQLRDMWCSFRGEFFPEFQAEVDRHLKSHHLTLEILNRSAGPSHLNIDNFSEVPVNTNEHMS